MDTWDAIRSRRDVRQFEDRTLEPSALIRIVEAGRLSPSSQNWQPWTFVVVTDRSDLAELSKVWKGAAQVAGSAATIALTAKKPDDAQTEARLHYDLGQATVSMMLAATNLGVGSGHSVVEDQELAGRILGLAEDEWCPYLLILGYPTKPLRPIEHPDRRSLDEVARWVTPSDQPVPASL
jgi:nitroreductase